STPGALKPWVQWYSIHTGIPASTHGVHHLTEGADRNDADIWRILWEHGHRVMSWLAMNAPRLGHPDSIYFPDPWSTAKPYPPELDNLYRLVAREIQEHSNTSTSTGLRTVADF